GYSACHWCHVMAHESFEDPDTAAIMNEYFINIKVDKEERPDLDKIYQSAHSMLTERPGGWPLTVFLTPDDHMPIFAGTYFPPQPAHGLPAFSQLLRHIHDVWLNRRDDIQKQSASLRDVYQGLEQAGAGSITLSTQPMDIARNQIEKQFDSKEGGFSQAPKFPHPAIIDRALQHWAQSVNNRQADPRILHSALYTLYKMCNGGIFDHLGGGFCRYSTDAEWMIPHFEKMLYDNGPLLALYAQAWCISDDARFYNTVIETADWVMREMQSADGGYYAAQDADSEGVEGKFFAWDRDEVNTVIEPRDWPLFEQRFGLDRPANFEGKWHLHGFRSEPELAKAQSMDIEAVFQHLARAKKQLFKHREQRIHPGRDEKILCAWNGLMIYGMASAGRLLGQYQYITSARRAADFIHNNCWRDQRLLASFKDGRARFNAYLDDYAFLLQGLLELLQCEWDNDLYNWALALADALLAQFEDRDNGGFYFTSHDHEQLIQRIKSFGDDAIPSGNAIACLALNRLGHLSGRTHYIDAAENCLKAGWQAINQAPISHCAMISALHDYLTPPTILVIRSQPADAAFCTTLSQHHYLPATLIFTIPAGQTPPPGLEAKLARKNTCAYPCQGYQCDAIIDSVADIHAYITNNSYRISE
ncbi:MAG TPA: thioredoxin domain-containing protein, partial [Thiotrichales bacterium]|nr:thioredoxin domain-containing protein [Thiotrichales bacterium]